ncbi:hypothetical protein QZH41_014712 [Actinostola sp. cb2023]|nr:hypothetical protein QZH41_014712 [Actinostola sp. cb2023]
MPFDEVCLANRLAKWNNELENGNIIITHNPLHSHESPYIPFIGNGKLGVAARKNSYLQIKEKILMEVPFEPLIEPTVSNGPVAKEATVINIKDGIVHHVQSYLWVVSAEITFRQKETKGWAKSTTKADRFHTHMQTTLSLTSDVQYMYAVKTTLSLTSDVQYMYAVKTTLSLTSDVQYMYAVKTTLSLTSDVQYMYAVKFAQNLDAPPSKFNDYLCVYFHSVSIKSRNINYDIHQGNVAYLDETHPGVNVTIVTTKTPSKLTVNGRGSLDLHHVGVVHTSINLKKSPHNTVDMKTLEEEANKDFKEVVGMNFKSLKTIHTNTWNNLWKTGIHVDPRHDPDTPPGGEVNATMYYLLSTFPTPDYDVNGKIRNVEEFEALLHAPEHCFGGPPTMHSASLWPIPRTEAAVSRMMASWNQVLTHNGCSSLIKAGATGIAQAMTLSFGGLQFSAGLFEFAANPASLHTSVTFRHIHLYKGIYINVSVIINEHTGHAEKLVIKSNLGDDKTPLYACEAGCQYEPVQLGLTQVVFPVRMTKPVTPILYISKSKSQLENIKKNVFIKDAHEESLRHHHMFHHVGLPAKFWVSIVFLIVAFHLYLVKLIYYECFKEPIKSKIYVS